MATSLELQQLYLAYLGRPPEPAAVTYYANQTVAQVEAALQSSAEGQQLYFSSAGRDDARVVNLAYVHLFNRLPSAAEIQFWSDIGTSQGLAQPALSQLIASSSQGSDSVSETNRMAYVQQWVGTFSTLAATNHVSTADFMALAVLQLAGITADPGTLVAANTGTTNTLSPPPAPSPAPPAPSPAPAPASNIFTTGTDHISTTNASVVYTATLEGASPTLTAGDSLTGAGNTLNVTDINGSTPDQWPIGFGLIGVSSLSLTTAGDAGSSATPLDTSFSNVVTHFTLNSTGTGVDYLLGGTATALTINSSAGSVQVSGGFSSLNVTDNNLGGAHALSLAGTGGAVTLHDPLGSTSLIISVDALTLTGGFTDASNKITSLTLAGSTNLSTIDAITDTALATLTVTGNVTLGVRSTNPFFLGANVTTVDLSGDTDTAGTNYFSIGSSNVTFKVAADTTVVNTAVFAGPTIAFGSITSGLSNSGPTGHGGPIASGGHTGAAFITDLVNSILGSKDVEYGNDGTNTYIVEADDGSHVQGNGFVRVVEIVGVSTVTVHSANISIS
jgi:hypothetical protein